MIYWWGCYSFVSLSTFKSLFFHLSLPLLLLFIYFSNYFFPTLHCPVTVSSFHFYFATSWKCDSPLDLNLLCQIVTFTLFLKKKQKNIHKRKKGLRALSLLTRCPAKPATRADIKHNKKQTQQLQAADQ